MVVFQCIIFLFILSTINSLNNNEYKIINQLPRSPLMKYYAYSSVMILHYYVPTDISEAKFEFQARDETTSIFGTKCDIRNISVHLKPGSYPVINPDGIPFPKTFLNITRPEIYELTLKTNNKPYYINISSPRPGDWFAVAFVSWTDPRKDKIEQQGLTSQCDAYLYSELAVIEQQNIFTISPNSRLEIPLKLNNTNIYKFYVPDDIDHIIIELKVLIPCKNCKNINNLLVYVQTASIPNSKNYQGTLIFNAKNETKQYLYFWPEEENWNYLTISFIDNFEPDFIKISLNLKYISGLQEEIYTTTNFTEKRINLFKTSLNKQMIVKNNFLQYSLPYKQYNLMRLTGSENFIFEYDFRSNKNESSPLLLNVTSNEMTVLKFTVQEIVDIGGTLSLGLAIKPTDVKEKTNSEKYKIIACLRANSKEIPVYPNLCIYNHTLKAPIVLNSTSAGTIEFLHIPYPDPGTYFLTIRVFDENCVPCNCSENCEQIYKDCLLNCEVNCSKDCYTCTEKCLTQILEEENCENCNCVGECTKLNETRNTSVIFAITSQPCIAGTCGNKGLCNHYMAGGFIFSSCHCKGGYRGWDCSDGSMALSDSEILLSILLLTLSNLLFIPSIYFAYKYGFYTEAITYFCAMFASTFYHACDSRENQYGYCMFPIGVLQFCDFYCGLLTIWITLVAMSYTTTRIISILHVAGAIILAFSVTYNKHALWVFVLPAVIGVLLICVNWGLQCRKTKKLFPAKKYLKIHMPIGGALVLMGLISFGFLETKENYKIVHSLWHVVMALSLIFLLPNKKVFVP